MSDEKDESINHVYYGIIFIVGAVVVITVLYLWLTPIYNVWSQGLRGEAKLREAESSRQIIQLEAHAKYEAAKDLAKAEVERAKGVAEANRIIGEGLKNNHEYLMYLWIHGMAEQSHQIIYVPTEGGLPILEAGRFQNPAKKK